MPNHDAMAGLLLALALGPAAVLYAQDPATMPDTATRPMHDMSEHSAQAATRSILSPPLPPDMTLDQVLQRAASPPPAEFPHAVMDDSLQAYFVFQQLEYRLGIDADNELGWRAQGWVGYDYDKLWLRTEGHAGLEGKHPGESENDLLYSRLIMPFWSAQAGVQYANEWDRDNYTDRWSGVLAIQGMAPGMFEVESSLYLSQEADVTLRFEAEYDLRLTQRLVLQPRTELRFAAQDVPERSLGAGLTSADAEVRLRYEIKREFAPYIGLGYHRLVGETSQMAQKAGKDNNALYLLLGLRLAF